MKRYRSWHRRNQKREKLKPTKLRFFMGGEYGENQDANSASSLGRPHYHAIIFGHDFDDREIYKRNHNGDHIYKSEQLSKLWGKGFCTIAAANYETACYVARYCMKKIGGKEAEDHYTRTDKLTGELTHLSPEFALMSNNPGIGRDWFLTYWKDFRKGFITMNGIKHGIPKYYVDQFAKHHPDDYTFLKELRKNSIDQLDPDNTLDRLRVKEKVKLIRTKTLKRSL